MEHATLTAPSASPLTGPGEHPMLDMPFHVEIDGRQYQGRGLSLVRAGIGGLIDPHASGTERLALFVFPFQGFVVALSIEVRILDIDPARGTAALEFLDPLGEHLPQLRHLMNAHIAGDLVTLGDTLAIRPGGAQKKGTAAPDGRGARRLGGTLALLALTLLLIGLVAGKVHQRVFTRTLATPALATLEGQTLAATATGQIDFLNPEAKAGEVAFAIRANTGQTLSVVLPCDCQVQLLGVEEGSTVFAGDPVLRASPPDAGVTLTGTALPEELLDLSRAGSVEVTFADGSEITARLATLGTAAPGELVTFRLTPDAALTDDRVGQLAEVTLRRPGPGLLRPLFAHSTPETKADAQ